MLIIFQNDDVLKYTPILSNQIYIGPSFDMIYGICFDVGKYSSGLKLMICNKYCNLFIEIIPVLMAYGM